MGCSNVDARVILKLPTESLVHKYFLSGLDSTCLVNGRLGTKSTEKKVTKTLSKGYMNSRVDGPLTVCIKYATHEYEWFLKLN